MQIFSDLKTNQAVFWGGKYVVNLPYGEYLDDDNNPIKGGGQVVLDSVENIRKVVNRPPKILLYRDSEGNEATPEDYRKLVDEKDQYWDEEDGDYYFPDLDTEFNFRKREAWFQQAEKVQTEPEIEYLPVEIEVVGSVEDTGSDFIETPFVHGKISWNPQGGIYKVYSSEIALDEWSKVAAKYGKDRFDNEGLGGWTKADLQFAKVDDKFVFTQFKSTPYLTKSGCVNIFSTLEEAQEKEERIRWVVRKMVLTVLSKKQPDEKTLGDIIRELGNIRKVTYEIDPKQRTESKHRSALDMLRKLEENLLEQLEEDR